MKKLMRKERGITLIALVVTIVVLLILAGVSIQMLAGSNGLLLQAKNAKTLTNKAEAKERLQVEVLESYETDGKINISKLYENLKNVSNLKYNNDVLSESNKIEKLPADVEINGDVYEIKEDGSIISVVNTIKPGEIITSEKGNTPYTNNGTAIIPVGFAIVPNLDNVSEGLVISDVENDIGNIGNQFVWIPVTNQADYNRNKTFSDIDVSSQAQYDTGYLPNDIIIGESSKENTMQKLTFEKEKELVTSQGGFYISRYEAGDGSSNNNRTASSGITGQLVSKKGAYVYNYITAEQAKEKAKTFKVQDSNKVKSALISGVQWDVVMTFISSKPRKDGNGEDDYIVTEISNPKSKRHTDSLTMSGQNNADKVCNIYDLEGNAWEYVAEKSTYGTTGPYVHRGGMYNDNFPASFRHNSDGGEAVDWGSFRFVLYVM